MSRAPRYGKYNNVEFTPIVYDPKILASAAEKEIGRLKRDLGARLNGGAAGGAAKKAVAAQKKIGAAEEVLKRLKEELEKARKREEAPKIGEARKGEGYEERSLHSAAKAAAALGPNVKARIVPLVDQDNEVFVSTGSGRKRPSVTFKIGLLRASAYYLWNVVTFVVCLLVLNLGVILTPPEDIADRLGNSLALLLTFAAFKITLAGDIPKVGYLTQLDKYLLASFFLSTCVGIEALVVQLLNMNGWGTSDLRKIDQLTAAMYVVLALLSHVPLFNQKNEKKKRENLMNDLLHHTNSSRELLPVGDEDD